MKPPLNAVTWLKTQAKKTGPVYSLIKKTHQTVRKLFFEVLRQVLPAWPRLGPSKGIFSAWNALKAGHVAGEVVLLQQNTPDKPTALRQRAGMKQEGFQPWPVFWTQHINARLIGESALLLDGWKRACSEAMFCHQQDGISDYHLLWLPQPIYLSGNWTSLLTRGWDANYYHWFMDCLPKLAVLKRLPPDTRILVPNDLKSFQMDTLRWLGLEQRIERLPGNHLIAESFFFSPPTTMTGCADPYGVAFLRDHFLPQATRPDPPLEKIFIQRRNKTRGIINEAEVVAFLKSLNWHVVDMESLSLSQQIGLFMGAKAVCAQHGAGLTNLAWCSPGCVVVEILAHNFLNGCYESLASCVGVEHRWLVQTADANNNMCVDLNQLQKILPE